VGGGGGLIRDCNGAWVTGFSRSIGIASCVQTELRALLDGLLLAIELDIPKLEIELNSLIVAELFTSTKIANIFLSSIVYDCIGVAIFDTTREPDTNSTRSSRVWVGA
jgi:hypothetical protein